MRIRSVDQALQYRGLNTPASCRDLLLQFQPVPSDSLKQLLIQMGPFEPDKDAFRFINGNSAFELTDEQVEQVRQRYREQIDFVLGANPLAPVTDALRELCIDVEIGHVCLSDIIDPMDVIREVQIDLAGKLAGLIVDKWVHAPNRCGGMAFSGYDFYLLGWLVDDRLGTTSHPPNSVLSDYIFSRLLDSLDSNAGTFLFWFAVLHLVPTLANVAVGIAVGGVGGPIGAAFGAYLANHLNLFGSVGRKALLKFSKSEWPRIKGALDSQAACPVGCLFGNSTVPTDDHQLLAVGYQDNGDGTATLMVWDNNEGNTQRSVGLDFRGDELQASNFLDDKPLKGIFLENYSPGQPPDSLRLPPP
jgi:hypothetical protein